MVEVATPSKVSLSLTFIFFQVMVMSRIDGIRNCLEDYILLEKYIFRKVYLYTFLGHGMVLKLRNVM